MLCCHGLVQKFDSIRPKQVWIREGHTQLEEGQVACQGCPACHLVVGGEGAQKLTRMLKKYLLAQSELLQMPDYSTGISSQLGEFPT